MKTRETRFALAVVVAACVVASPTLARPSFSIGAVDAADGMVAGSRPGTGIDLAGGVFFQVEDPGPPWVPPPPFPVHAEFDSYVTLGSGPWEPGSFNPPIDPVETGPGFSDSNYRGGWYVSGPFVDAFEAIDKPGVSWQLFLGRFTHTGNLSGRVALALAEEGAAGFRTVMGDIVTPSEVNGGQGWITEDVNGAALIGPQLTDEVYAFVIKEFEQEIEGVTYTVSDLYIQSLAPVPSPGGVGVCAVCGGCALRRRIRSAP